MDQMNTKPYSLTHHVRIVTAASLFDGHDAAINIMRRILQSSGAEVIHLGHNRSVKEIVDCAIQEDAQGIALTSYQGGHVEYLKYMHDQLAARGAVIKIYAGGGIVIDERDEELAASIADMGIRVAVTDTLMRNEKIATDVASEALRLAQSLRESAP